MAYLWVSGFPFLATRQMAKANKALSVFAWKVINAVTHPWVAALERDDYHRENYAALMTRALKEVWGLDPDDVK